MYKFQKILLLPFLAAVIFLSVSFTSSSEKYFEIAKNLDIFATLYKEINAYYVDEVNPSKLIRTGINAMLESLDPYTDYIPEDDIEDYRTMMTGQYGGIGAVIGNRNGRVLILMPYEGFPAFKSGLKIGDEIVEIDEFNVKGKSTEDISKLLKGQANTSLEIKINRYGQKDLIDIQITREKITIGNVPYYGLISGSIGYVKLGDFTINAGREIRKVIEEMKSQGADKFILDLRNNPGGLLGEAVNVANVFIPKDYEVVSTKGKVIEWNKSYKTLDQPADVKVPIAVLTNSRSASASEIVSGVIQDYDRGVLIGRKTFGKGLVQATRPLTYNSQLKVTTAKYYIPSGRCIQSIDYSHRNEDGSVGKLPDSLKVAFETRNGRKVFDGGGIDPDVTVELSEQVPIIISLISKGLIFDYGTEYFYSKKQVHSPRDFKITDKDYENFIKWLSDKKYDYTTKVEKSIDDLIQAAKHEKYYSDIEEPILHLRASVMHNKEQDLQKFKEKIKEALETEIVSRYFLRKGVIESSFDDDPDVQKALEVLSNEKEYNRLLAKKVEPK